MSFFRLARYALFLGLGCLRAADVEVSDENLESLIRSALEKPEGALTTADMESLTALSSDGGTLLDSEKIEGLGGLQFATGLKSLHLPRHTLSDLSPLANLTELESLDLAGNRIDDCSAVAWLTSIVWLDLSDNHLTSVAPLGGFDDSVFIDVSRNFLDLDDFLTAWVIDGLKSAGVEVLFSEQDTTSLSIGVDKDHFDDGGGVGMATVESNTYWTASSDSDWLVLSPGAENGFGNDTFSFSVSVLPEGVTHRLGYISAGEDVVEISQGTGIVVELSDAVLEWHVRETLGRHEGSITVSHMEQLTQLALSGLDLFPDLPFENLSGLEYATNLLTLSIVDSEVSNLDPIRGLSSLKSLYVYDADLGDAGDLSGLSSLDSLTLYSCSLTEIPQLPESLERLFLSGNSIVDLTPLAGRPQLVAVEINDNQIADLGPLSGLVNLRSLRLDNNAIRGIAPLAGLASLEDLLIYSNHIRSIEAIASLPKLTEVGLHYNYIDFSEGGTEAGYLQEMRDRGVQFLNTTQFAPALVAQMEGDPWGPSGGTGEISVVSGTYWSAWTDADWITVIGGTARFGDGALEFEVALAPDLVQNRSGTIWVEDVGVTITQRRKIDIPDPVLEAAVRAETGVAERDLLEIDLESLVSLAISAEAGAADSEKLSDLSALEFATNLETLSLGNTLLANLDPIRELPGLRVLSMNGSDLGDAGDLSGLGSLESLTMKDCTLTEIPQLPDSLGALYLSGNVIADLTPLAGQTQLVALEIDDNDIRDIGPLASLAALENLLINSNHIRSIEAIASLPKLSEVGLHDNYIDFSAGGAEAGYLQEMRDRGVQFPNTTQFSAVPLVALEGGPWGPSGGAGEISVVSGTYWSASTDADWISLIDAADRLGSDAFAFEVASAPDLAQNRSGTIWVEDVGVTITQYPALSIPDPVLEAAIRDALELPDRNLLAPDLAMLEQLVVEGLSEAGESEKLADLSGLEHAVNLEHLTLSGTLVSSLEPLRDLTKLRVLFTNGSLIEEATQISGLASLELLTLANGGLQQIPSMPASVISLDLSGNAISDLSPLADESQLVRLELADNRIADLAPLAGLSNLRSLSLKSNLVQDASDLKDLLKLEELLINGNHLRSAEEFLSLTALKYLDARFNYIDVAPGGEGATTLQQLAGQGVEAYLEAQMNPIPNLANGLAAVGHSSLNLSVDFETSTFWSASADVPWVELSRIEGFESAMLNLRIGANHTNAERIATVTISGASFTVTQGYDEEYFGYIAAKGRETGQQINWPNEDADGDGVSNREEFELGANPFDGAWAPVFGIRECEDAANVLVVGRVEDGVSRVIEFSEDLVGWIELKVESEEMEAGTLLFRDELTAGERGSPRFYRQRIDR